MLYTTIALNVTTRGTIARFSERDRCLFHSLDAESISDAPRRMIRQSTAATLTSATPIVVNALMADVVADVVLMADVVLSIDDNILDFSLLYTVFNSVLYDLLLLLRL
jgi:hypothetical protein